MKKYSCLDHALAAPIAMSVVGQVANVANLRTDCQSVHPGEGPDTWRTASRAGLRRPFLCSEVLRNTHRYIFVLKSGESSAGASVL
jgi:hypothetical protein